MRRLRREPIAFALIGAIAVLLVASRPTRDLPALPTHFHRGTNHAHVHARGHGYGSEASQQSLRRLQQLGIDSVALTTFAYQRRADSPVLQVPAADSSLTDADLIREIRNAKALGLRVLLKPHVWSRDFWHGAEWHGTIRQSTTAEQARWWASYRALVLHQARIALAEGVDVLCLGTELVQLTRPERHAQWRELIARLREMIAEDEGSSLALTYAAHWDHELDQIPFWSELDAIGVSAYFPLDAPPGASVAQLVAAWEPHVSRLEAMQAAHDRPVWFLEAGYRKVRGTHREPWNFEGGVRDGDAQARAYEALFLALGERPWWQGLYLWKSFTDPEHPSERDGGDGYGFLDSATASTIRSAFAAMDSTP